MPRPNALLGEVAAISKPSATIVAAEHPSARYMTVTFSDGRIGLLDGTSHRSRVWAEVLESLRENRQPAYVEIDPETNEITDVLQPVRYSVAHVSSTRDGLDVTLMISHARHVLRRANPDFEGLRKTLEDAQKRSTPVLVVENDDHEIVVVRHAPQGPPVTKARKGRR